MADTSSKKVRLKRAGSFLSRSQGSTVDSFFQDAIQEVGSYFENSFSKRIASGMSIEEEKLLMPDLIGVQPTDREYPQRRDLFFATISTKVPFKDGVELEIGLKDNSKPLSATNLPIDVASYVRYRQVKKHPWVAADEESARGNQLMRFYLSNPIEETNAANAQSDDRDAATAHYLKIKDNSDKIDMMLTLLGVDPRSIEGQSEDHAKSLRKQKLRELVDTVPGKIMELSEDKQFENKFLIQSMVNTGTLKVVGQRYYISETDEPIGNYAETLDFFRNEKNASVVETLKAKHQEASRTNKRVKKTVNE